VTNHGFAQSGFTGQGTDPAFVPQASQVIQNPQNFLTAFCHNYRMSSGSVTQYPTSQDKRTAYRLPLHGLAALRILIVLAIGLGYASTMGIGTDSLELGHHWGYDPSWYGVQLLFVLSGFLAMRSMSQGRSVFDFFGSRIWSLWPALIAATFVTVAIIYPLMCAPDAANRMGLGNLALYFVKTIFLIEPGAPMPGLLDDAKYACLIQGAIWTLRWGLILHVAFLIGWFSTLLKRPKLLLALAISVTLGYIALVYAAVQIDALGQIVEPFLPGLRLGYAYLIGTALFAWQHKLKLSWPRVVLLAAVLAFLATAHLAFLPWTPIMEILGTAFWLILCLGFLAHAPRAIRRCPRITPVLYVSIWPAAQVVVALVPDLSQIGVVEFSILLACGGALLIFLLLRQARVQPARL